MVTTSEGKVVIGVRFEKVMGRHDPLEPVVASCERIPLEDDVEDELAEGHREDRKVDAPQAHAEEAEDSGRRTGRNHRRGEADKKRPVGLHHQQPRRIRAHAVVGGVAEAQLSHVAEDQVEAHGEQAEDQYLREYVHPELACKDGDQDGRDKRPCHG